MPNKKSLVVSFEFFPPKSPEGFNKLYTTALSLAVCKPDFFSVTFGAGGSTHEGTLEAVIQLQRIGVPIAPHLACIGMKRAELITILKKYQMLDIKRLITLRGDLPSGIVANGDLSFADELVKLARETTQDCFYIEVAAYPEVHPQAKTAEADILHLKRKMDAGANSAITQYFFNPDAYFYFVDHCIKHGVTIPIVPGIMPITSFEKLVRFSNLCGAEIPRWIRKRLEDYAINPSDLAKFGFEVVHHLCDRLIQGGVTGLHFYTLNHAEASLALVNALGNYSRGS